MSKICSALFTLLLIAAFTPSTTHADPLVITSGFLTITGPVGAPRYSFAGDNFAVIGGAGDRGSSSPQVSCSPCFSGQLVNVGGVFIGSSLGGGSVALDGNVFPTLGFSGTFILSGPSFAVPFSLSDITVTSPFTFTGHLVGCPQSCVTNFPVLSVDMIGSGFASIDLRFSGFDREGRPLFSFQKVTYEFEVPEPMSILLLGGGLAALGAKLRRNKRRL